MRNLGIGLTMVCLTLCLYVVSQAGTDPSLVLCFDFEDGKGDTVKDRSTYGNNGNIEGNAEWVDGKFGKGLKLDGTSVVLVPDSDEFHIADEVTLACWAKVESVDGRYNFLVCRWNWAAGNNLCYEMYLSTGAPTFVISSDSATYTEAVSPDAIDIDKWYNIVGVFDGSKVMIYVDGKEMKSAGHGGKIFDGKGSICIGDNNSGIAPDYRFVGVIDEVAIYNRALSQDEIKQKMTSGHVLVVKYKGKLATIWGGIKVRY